jgi:hypothetical protein
MLSNGLLAAVTALLLTLATATSARAEIEYPWCAQFGGGSMNGINATNCGFVTVQQCRETISGLGGMCYENPRYHGPADRRIRQRH